MSNVLDLKGKVFGRLTVIKRVENNKRRDSMWLCRCECGTEKIIQGYRLRIGKTRSCGCLCKENVFKCRCTPPTNKLKSGVSNMRRIITGYKKSAKKRGYEYKLTEEQFAEITQKDCFYCGAKPNNISKRKPNKQANGEYIYNGIDRVDNIKGYTIDNIVPCCRFCNIRKGKLTLKEYKDWIKKSYEILFKEGDKRDDTGKVDIKE